VCGRCALAPCSQTTHSEDAVFIDMYGQELDQVSDWMMDGYKVVARGQVAVVLIAGESVCCVAVCVCECV